MGRISVYFSRIHCPSVAMDGAVGSAAADSVALAVDADADAEDPRGRAGEAMYGYGK